MTESERILNVACGNDMQDGDVKIILEHIARIASIFETEAHDAKGLKNQRCVARNASRALSLHLDALESIVGRSPTVESDGT